jgi:galactonate dehydratase
MRIFNDAVADIRPPDARSYFNLEPAPMSADSP